MISGSPSGISNGVRLVSAIAAVREQDEAERLREDAPAVPMSLMSKMPCAERRSRPARACRRRGTRRGRPGPWSPRTTSSATRRAGRRAAPTCCARPSRRAWCRRPRATRSRSRRAGRRRAARSAGGSAARRRRRVGQRLERAGASTAARRTARWRRDDQRRRDRHDRRQREQEPVGLRRHEVLLGMNFSASATKWVMPQARKRADGGAVRTEAVLHHRRLPPLDPGQERRERHHEQQHHEAGSSIGRRRPR